MLMQTERPSRIQAPVRNTTQAQPAPMNVLHESQSSPFPLPGANLDYSDFLNAEFLDPSSSLLTPLGAQQSATASSSQSPSSLQSSPGPETPYGLLGDSSSIFSPPSGSPSDFFNFLDASAHDVRSMAGDLVSKSSSTGNPFELAAFDFSGAAAVKQPPSQQLPSPAGTIDPSLMGTPSTVSFDDFDMGDNGEPKSSLVSEQPQKLVVTIPPVKAGGHGKGARKGTVHSAGVTKSRTATNRKSSAAPVTVPATSPSSPSTCLPNIDSATSADNIDDDNDLPADWRPPPEVFAKMSSKEKRQLRNKISARNFRVRRKEYISTLEMDIAERDKLLAAIRSELGSSQSENHALRQEIAALKRALLSGRPPSPSLLNSTSEGLEALNLPPPAPLPETTAAQRLAQNGTTSTSAQQITPPTSPLIKPNVSKDMPSSSSSQKAFWGGVNLGLGGGVTPVHRMVLPEVDLERAFHSHRSDGNGENINPLMNNLGPSPAKKLDTGLDQFGDGNIFNIKSMDAYRMHLWTQMALRNQQQQSSSKRMTTQTSPTLSGMAANIRPHYFMGGLGTSKPGLLTPPASPILLPRKALSSSSTATSPASSSAPKPEEVYVAHLASQTLLKRLGSAFWDAFKGKEDNVQKVLEGRAVLKVVDVEKPTSPLLSAKSAPALARRMSSPASGNTGTYPPNGCPSSVVTDLLEESMRSLCLATKK